MDTSALIALAVPTDKNHRAASSFLGDAVKHGTRFVLGRPVLIEYVDGVTKRVGKSQAIRQLQSIEASGAIRVEPETEEDHRNARELFLRYDDHAIDLTDSLSFAIMERLGLKEAFTFDRDFVVHGFACQPLSEHDPATTRDAGTRRP